MNGKSFMTKNCKRFFKVLIAIILFFGIFSNSFVNANESNFTGWNDQFVTYKPIVTMLYGRNTLNVANNNAVFVDETQDEASFGGTTALDGIMNQEIKPVYDTYMSQPGIFCEEHGLPLNNDHPGDIPFEKLMNGGEIEFSAGEHDNDYNTLKTTRNYKNVTYFNNPTAEEIYIMAHSQAGDDTPAQIAWWNKGGSAATGEDINEREKVADSKNKENTDMWKSFVDAVFERKDIRNEVKNEIKTYMGSKYNKVKILAYYQVLLDQDDSMKSKASDSERVKLLDLIVEVWNSYRATSSATQESLTNALTNKVEAAAFQDYVNKTLATNSFNQNDRVANAADLKNQPSIVKDERFTVAYNGGTCYIGPITYNYPNYMTSGGKRFAGISGVTLNIVNVNGDVISANHVTDANYLAVGEYRFRTSKNGAVGKEVLEYPADGEQFFIELAIDPTFASIKNFGFKYKYMVYSGTGYKVYRSGKVYSIKWRTEGVVDYTKKYEVNYIEKNVNHSSCDWSYPINEAGTKNVNENRYLLESEINSSYLGERIGNRVQVGNGNRVYCNVLDEYVTLKITRELKDITNITPKLKYYASLGECISDEQDLAQAGKAYLWYKEGELLEDIGGRISIRKKVVDNENVEINEPQEFNFLVYSDKDVFKTKETAEVTANGETNILYFVSQESVPGDGTCKLLDLPDSIDDQEIKYVIVEVDQYGLTYEEWKAQENDSDAMASSQHRFSMWNDYTPKNLGVAQKVENAAYLFEIENVKNTQHSHLIIEKQLSVDDYNRLKDEIGKPKFYARVELADGGKIFTVELELDDQESRKDIDEGYIVTGIENGMVYAKYYSNKIVFAINNASYQIVEVDAFNNSYEEWKHESNPRAKEASIWNYLKAPVYDGNSELSVVKGSLNNHICNGKCNSQEENKVVYTSIFNQCNEKNKLLQLDLIKYENDVIRNEDGSITEVPKEKLIKRDVDIDVTVESRKDANSEINLESFQTVRLQTNSQEGKRINYEVMPYKKDYEFFVTLKEKASALKKLNDANSDGIKIVTNNELQTNSIYDYASTNPNNWICIQDDFGNIIQATKKYDFKDNHYEVVELYNSTRSAYIVINKEILGEISDSMPEFTATISFHKNKYTEAIMIDGEDISEKGSEYTVRFNSEKPAIVRVEWIGDSPLYKIEEVKIPVGWIGVGLRTESEGDIQSSIIKDWSLLEESDENDYFVNYVSFINTKTGFVIKKDTNGVDKEQKFNVVVQVKAKEGTKDLTVLGKKYDIEHPYVGRFSISEDQPFELDDIQWTGEAPQWLVVEVDIPENWELDGYKYSDGNIYKNVHWADLNCEKDLNVVTVKNKKTEKPLIIHKIIKDLNGNVTTISKDFDFYFDIWVNNDADYENAYYEIEDNNYEFIPVLDDEIKYAKYKGMTLIGRVKVPFSEGESDKNITICDVNPSDKGSRYFAAIEVDQNGERYPENGDLTKVANDSLWYYTKPENNGVFQTIVNEKGDCYTLDAVNIIGKLTIPLKKWVIDVNDQVENIEDAEQPLEEKEHFYFDVVVYDSKENIVKEERLIDISIDNPTKEIVLENLSYMEKYTVITSEYDYINNEKVYFDENNRRGFWKDFEPADKYGITKTILELDQITDELQPQLNGVNKRAFEIELTKKSDGGPIKLGEEFFFIIKKDDKQLSENELKEIIEEEYHNMIDGNRIKLFVEKVDDTHIILHDYIKTKALNSSEKEKYEINEVDQYNELCSSENLKEDSLWHKYSVENDGIWKLSENQPNIIIDNKTDDHRYVLIKKEKVSGWTNNESYVVKIYKNNQLFKKVTLSKDNCFDSFWCKKTDTIAVVEENYKPIKITMSTMETNKNENLYDPKLDENGNPTNYISVMNYPSFTVDIVNDDDGIDYYLTLKKTAAQGSEKYRFSVKIGNSDAKVVELGNGDTMKFGPFKVNSDGSRNSIKYEITELEKTPKCIKVDGKEVSTNQANISGTFSDDINIEVVNNIDYEEGSIEALKSFIGQKGWPAKTVFEEWFKKYPGKLEFKFNLIINSKSSFWYDDEEILANKDLVFNSSLIIDEQYLKSGNFEDIKLVFTDKNGKKLEKISVKWAKGSPAPQFKFKEDEPTSCWKLTQITNNTSTFENGKTITIKRINSINVFEDITLFTNLAGVVWEDEATQKDSATPGEMGEVNGKFDRNKEHKIGDVYVRVARMLLKGDKEGNVNVEKISYNNDSQFIYDISTDYYYINEANWDIDTNYEPTWKFERVAFPSFTIEEMKQHGFYDKETENAYPQAMFDAGYRVKYYVEYFYNGVEYEATKFIATSNEKENKNKAKDFKKNWQNGGFYNDSFAVENPDYRADWNSQYQTLTTANGGKTTVDDHSSKGQLSAGDTVNADVEYTSYSVDGRDGTYYGSTGDVIINATTKEGDPNRFTTKYMCATTEAGELTYFLEGEMYTGNNEVIKDDGSRVVLNPANSDFMEEYQGIDEKGINFLLTYRKIYEYSRNINLGLVKRPKADVAVAKYPVLATVMINENVETYKINPDFSIADLKEDIIFKLGNTVENNGELNIYTSDYNYRTRYEKGSDLETKYTEFYNTLYRLNNENEILKAKELQIYITYGISLRNNSANYDVEIEKIDDYSESTLEYVDLTNGYIADGNLNDNKENYMETSGLYAYIAPKEKDVKDKDSEKYGKYDLQNVLRDYSEYYEENATFKLDQYIDTKDIEYIGIDSESYKLNKATIKLNDTQCKLNAKEQKTFYLTYKVKHFDKLDDFEFILGAKINVAEAASMTTYYESNYAKSKGINRNEKVYGATIDENSLPGNYSFNCAEIMEDDTSLAIVNIRDQVTDKRTVSGKAFFDKSKDGIKDADDSKIEGVRTTLVEVVDIPEVRDNKITNEVNEFEHYFETAQNVYTDENGEYTFDNIVPGNYIVRFIYGDRDTITDSNITVNGEDYQTTVYEPGVEDGDYLNNIWEHDTDNTNMNKARDNEARRVQLIAKTQILDNENTAMFNVANYSSEDKYIEGMKTNNYITSDRDDTKEDLNKLFTERYEEYKKALYGNYMIENDTYAYNGLIYDYENSTDESGYYMFADTAKMHLDLKRYLRNDENEYVKVDNKYVEDPNCKLYYRGMNLGLALRPETTVIVDKQIEEITLSGSNNEIIFNALFDINYSKGSGETLIYKAEKEKDNIYVNISINEENAVNVNNLQKLNDMFNEDNSINANKLIQGFRYLNIDEDFKQGLKINVKYKITTLNLSEEDYIGEKLYKCIYKDKDELSMEDRIENMINAVEELKKTEYKFDSKDNSLKLVNTGKVKNYGEYVSNFYYTSVKGKNDKIAKSTVRQIIDYVDNTIEFDSTSGQPFTKVNVKEDINKESEDTIKLDSTILEEKAGAFVIKDQSGNTIKNVLVTLDSKENNKDLVSLKEPIKLAEGESEIEWDGISFTQLDLSKVLASNDGDTKVDNIAEILRLENLVGRRDMKVVYGNYNPRWGPDKVREHDESSTENITLSPPTGNYENDRNSVIAITIVMSVALISGIGVVVFKRLR